MLRSCNAGPGPVYLKLSLPPPKKKRRPPPLVTATACRSHDTFLVELILLSRARPGTRVMIIFAEHLVRSRAIAALPGARRKIARTTSRLVASAAPRADRLHIARIRRVPLVRFVLGLEAVGSPLPPARSRPDRPRPSHFESELELSFI